MNAYHRVLANEPPIVAELLNTQTSVPKWGADDEDSKTPLREDLIDAGINLSRCFDGTIKLEENGKNYQLAESHLSQPFKRFSGLSASVFILVL
jgi:malate synthase